MPIPDFQTCMLPLLRELRDGRETRLRDVTDTLADVFALTPEERATNLPSGQTPVFRSRVHWAKTYLKAAGLIDNPSRGRVRISAQGQAVLAEDPPEINMAFLDRFPGYVDFMRRSRKIKDAEPIADVEPEESQSATPQESLNLAYQTLREATKEELLTRLKNCSPSFFERAVMKVLQAMGYGGIEGDGEVTGQPGDGGIDGVIREDKLGLDLVCVQAKRWSDNTIPRATVQQFAGSMDIYKAKKGVIITTSKFSRDAISFIERIEGKRVVLIDGDRLTELMMDYNVGVSTTETYEVKEVSNDFFDEDEA